MIKFLVYVLLAAGFSLIGVVMEKLGLFLGSHALSALFGYLYGAFSLIIVLRVNRCIK